MTKKNIVVINGRTYDAITGLPLNDVATTPEKKQVSESHSVAVKVRQPASHRKKPIQRSQTLRREAVKRPSPKQPVQLRKKPAVHTVTKSPQIHKFAPHPVSTLKTDSVPVRRTTASTSKPDMIRESHTVRATHHRLATKAKPSSTPKKQTSQELKKSLIEQSLARATPASPNQKHPSAKKRFQKPLKTSSVMAGSLAIIMLGGYLTYINMPGISTRVAAAQAGIEASFPGYKPDGYRFKGPVAYEAGEVAVAFASVSGSQHYEVHQRESNWDSQTVLDNYVSQKTGNYTANTSQGVTVYTYEDGAAWVNKGMFYTLEGNATLSTEQVLRIANSM